MIRGPMREKKSSKMCADIAGFRSPALGEFMVFWFGKFANKNIYNKIRFLIK